MYRITFWLLWIFVFSVPWETFSVAFNVSTLSRILGVATIAFGFLTTAASGRLRRPGPIIWLAVAFTLMSVLSLLWTISPNESVNRAFTYGQLLGLVFLVREFARTREQQQLLMVAYCLGACVVIGDLMRRFVSGQVVFDYRYTGANLDPNDLGLTLAIGIPMAWYLFLNRSHVWRILGATYIPIALVAILLTASRGAFVAALVSLSIVPLTLPWRSRRSLMLSTGVLLAAGMATFVVPEASWNRIFTTVQEATSGTASGRFEIWRAGLEAFQQGPVFGSGVGAFELAIEPFLGRVAPHNVFLAILVEQGMVGAVLFGGLLGACAHGIYYLPRRERSLFAVIGLTWLVGAMTLSWQYRKITWLVIALIATQTAVVSVRQEVSERRRRRTMPVFSRNPATGPIAQRGVSR